jgi:hypothetical protein
VSNYKFKSKDFYDLLEKQKYRCFYSGRELTPANTQAVHIQNLKAGGKHILSNIVLVDKDVYLSKKYLEQDDLLELSVEIIRHYGNNKGYRIVKSRK